MYVYIPRCKAIKEETREDMHAHAESNQSNRSSDTKQQNRATVGQLRDSLRCKTWSIPSLKSQPINKRSDQSTM